VPGSLDDPNGHRANLNESVWVASHGPVAVRADSSVRVDLSFEPVQTMHPPVLMALMDVRKLALDLIKQRGGAPAFARSAALAQPAYAAGRNVA
jgi:hypothetical protein